MPNIIKPKRSNSAGVVPTTSNLTSGEIGVNMADQKVYINNGTAVVQVGAGNLSGLGDTNITSPANGQSLQYNSATGKWINASGGSGDVQGPASSTDNALARFDGATGKVIQNGTITQDDLGNLAGILSETYNTVTTPPTIVEGLEAWDSGNGTLELGLKGGVVSYKYGQQEYLRAYNGSGTAMTKGQVVYIVGAQGNRVDVRLAKADSDTTSASTIGFVAESIANGGEGFVLVSGNLPKLDTSTLTAGATIYLSPTTAGAYTTTAPTAPNHRVILGWVERVSATVGSFYVKVDNGYELDELHNVLITNPVNGNTIIYDAVTGVWENASLTAGAGVSVTNGAGSITIANTGVTSLTGTANEIDVSASTGGVTISLPETINANLNGNANTVTNGVYTNGSYANPTWITSLAGSKISGNINNGGSIYARGSFGMNSSTIAGNPLLYDVQDQAGNVVIEIGRTDGTAGTSVLDFHSGATAVDYDARMQATGGNGTTGGGTLNFISANFRHNSVDVVTTSGTQTLTNKTISGSSNTFSNIANSSLTNSSITINGTAVSLGGSTSVGTVTGVTATSPVASSGGTAPVISLSSGYGDTQNPYASKTANFFLASPNGTAGAPTFRAIVASDIPTLNQNTTGTASNVTGTVAIANGGTGSTTASGARTNLGATTVGGNLFTLTNPSAITFPRFNADNTVSALDASTFRTAIGAGTGNGTVTSIVAGTGLSGGTITSSGTIALANTAVTAGSYTNANITVDAQGRITSASNGTSASGTVTSVSGTGTVSGLTLTGTVTSSGSLTLGGNLSITADMIYDSFTATASQTTFTTSQTYTANKIEVFVNGVKMVNGAGNDVTVSGGTSVVMAFALTAGDRVDLVYPI